MSPWYYQDYYPPSQPRQTKGGIKAHSKRGSFGNSWWAKRWIAVLESFNIGARLGRGRSYARKGQVISIDVEKGSIDAQVQGSRSRPYNVTIRVGTLAESDWAKLAKALTQQTIFAAKLMAGEMPENIEGTFEKTNLSLFPEKQGDLETDCSCPDWSNPCKHIAAVYYLLGEEFDRDPFLMFRLRGIERDELISLIADQSGVMEMTSESDSANEEESELPAEPLPLAPDAFWGNTDSEEEILCEAYIPEVSAALPKRLGGFPFWRGDAVFLITMEQLYRSASEVGLNVFLGEKPLIEVE